MIENLFKINKTHKSNHPVPRDLLQKINLNFQTSVEKREKTSMQVTHR
jgi:hypothetical protein